ncbi:tRNA lysidine(34) synthetase TilS [Acinetobacter cumulans]|uniref:tRNA(Ile)-lysidine synthase n=1 Tax=Acinetobacter cumulans TaxID=2136182 RepID=A0A498CZ24_9GAMM|nr:MULTISPECIES: tRNA lysidine(34) synthetase TilS [Acinetobacter]RFS28071.1 tRNA lysidine(34) synthetase TilS [Acinetobacter sp. SWAC5]RLL34131.1 tRNA lysidine(34) synthetase TilS [Acinetobacter cumulans]
MRSTLPTFNEIWQQQFRTGFLSQSQAFSAQTRFLIGCSGGMDSMLLLHLMSELCPNHTRAIYIDHQLQSQSASWGEFVAEQCQQRNIPCIVQAVEVATGNLENQARQARYDAYLQHLAPNEVLVLAHHQQDQAETLMLRLLSGAGIHGLAAMQAVDVREEMTIWRPLLDVSREQICQWAHQLNVKNIEDPTNLDTHYDRAWCREILWPLLESRYPKMQQALSRTSYLMQDAEEILASVLETDLKACGSGQALCLETLLALPQARQRQLLSAWMKGLAQYRPAFEMVQRLVNEVILAKADAQAALHWNGFYYVRFAGWMYRLAKAEYLASAQEQTVPSTLSLDLHQVFTVLSGKFQVQENRHVQAMGLSPALLNKPLMLTPRQGGEKIHLQGRVGSWPLKKAIQQAQIFPWQRHTIQILSIDNVMLGVFTPKGFWLAVSSYCVIGGWRPNVISTVENITSGLES